MFHYHSSVNIEQHGHLGLRQPNCISIYTYVQLYSAVRLVQDDFILLHDKS